MRLSDMLQALVKTRHANALGDELKDARLRLEAASNDLVKTLDEMLDATNAANARRDRVQDVKKRKDH